MPCAFQTVVLDEADKLFELGKEGKLEQDAAFLGQVDEILGECNHPQVRRKQSDL